MSGGRKKKDGGQTTDDTASRRPLSLRVFLCILVICGLFVGMFAAWRWVGDRVAGDPSYFVSPENIEVTSPPDWIAKDITAEVAELLSSESLDIREPELTVRIARAFAMHPWVANVRRVSKRPPGRVIVELEYRCPIAVVEFASKEGSRWLYPIDAAGVLLPPQDFSQEQARKLCRINVGATMHAGPVGSAWGDSRVHGAARIAEVLAPYWHPLGLYRIEAHGKGRSVAAGKQTVYELVTRKGTRVSWGHCPGEEEEREPNAESKIGRLLAQAKKGGGLDSSEGSAALDLRIPTPAGERTDTATTGARPVR
jgi:hypothetical protein